VKTSSPLKSARSARASRGRPFDVARPERGGASLGANETRPGAQHTAGPRLVVAVRPGDALGFRLAGAHVEEVACGDEAQVFRRLMADPRAGVLAVEEELLGAVPGPALRRARERGVPVLLPFALPRRWGDPGRGRAYVATLIRRAVGYAVKLGGRGGEP
jgi:V/A-type H+-transporting ATPase subunit F